MSDAESALTKAKIGLMQEPYKSAFLSTVVFSLKHSFRDDIPTAGTDGIHVYYNPEFFLSLTKEERIGLVAHEAWHVALLHMTRENGREHDLWNMAGDYIINHTLIRNGYTLPKQGLHDSKYDASWTTEKVYDDLKQQGKEAPSNLMKDIIFGDGDKDDGGTSKKEIEAAVKEILVKASTISKMQGEKAGKIPGEIQRAIDNLLNPQISWNELLQRYLTEKIKDDYSWKKPNRRFMPDYYLPTQYSDGLGEVTVAIDTSGSITPKQLQAILSEIEYIKDTMKPSKLNILDCDWSIHNTYEITPDNNQSILDLKFSGGGGTSFQPVIDFCDERPTQVLIYFTDLYADQIREKKEYDILWVCYSEHEPAPVGETIYTEFPNGY